VSAKSTITPDFESLQDAAVRIGYSVFTLRELIAEGKLAAYRINDKPGSTIRVRRTDVDALMRPLIPAAVYADRDGGAK
jgi:excisionase family DNA binding protein